MNIELLAYYHQEKLTPYLTHNYRLETDDIIGLRGDGDVICVKCFTERNETRLFKTNKGQLMALRICLCWSTTREGTSHECKPAGKIYSSDDTVIYMASKKRKDRKLRSI